MTLYQVPGVANLKGPGFADVSVSKTPTGGWGEPESRHIIIEDEASGYTSGSGPWSNGGIDSHFYFDDDPSDPYWGLLAVSVAGAFNPTRTATVNGFIQVGPDQHPFVLTKVAALMADGPALASADLATEIGQADLARLAAAATSQWWADGSLNRTIAAVRPIRFEIANLAGNLLAITTPEVIYLDRDAAGYGWYVDPTPWSNEEFTATSATSFRARETSPAADRMDLLTVISHELGHILGFDDLEGEGRPGQHHGGDSRTRRAAGAVGGGRGCGVRRRSLTRKKQGFHWRPMENVTGR